MVWIGDIAPILVFLAIVAGIWAILSFISNRNSKLNIAPTGPPATGGPFISGFIVSIQP